jgi:hypothetical protein
MERSCTTLRFEDTHCALAFADYYNRLCTPLAVEEGFVLSQRKLREMTLGCSISKHACLFILVWTLISKQAVV